MDGNILGGVVKLISNLFVWRVFGHGLASEGSISSMIPIVIESYDVRDFKKFKLKPTELQITFKISIRFEANTFLMILNLSSMRAE